MVASISKYLKGVDSAAYLETRFGPTVGVGRVQPVMRPGREGTSCHSAEGYAVHVRGSEHVREIGRHQREIGRHQPDGEL